MLMAAAADANPPIVALPAARTTGPDPSGLSATAAVEARPSATSEALPSLGQTALSLMLVLGLIFALAWLLKRVQGVRVGGPASLRINAGLQVGPKEKVLIIEAGGQHLLIGVTAGAISTLHVFAEAPVAPSNDGDGKPAQPPMATAFSEALKRALGQEPKS